MKENLVWRGGELSVHTEYEREGKTRQEWAGRGGTRSIGKSKQGGGAKQTFGLCALFVDDLLQRAAEDFVTLSTKGGPFTPYIRRVDGVLP